MGDCMSRFIRTAVATVSLTMMSTAAFAQCMIFSEPNYQGAQGVIQPNDYVKFFEGGEGKSQHKGSEGARTFTDVSWRDKIGSTKVTNGCSLVTWDKAEGKTTHRRYLVDSPEMIANMQKSVATETAAAFCECK